MAGRKDYISRYDSLMHAGTLYDRSLITTHTLKRWKKKVNHLGYLTLDELRPAAEDLREDMLGVLKILECK